jgi:hypothetical protein
MSLIEINWNPPPKQLRAFAVAQFVFFTLIAALMYARTSHSLLPLGLTIGSAIVGALGFAFPPLIRMVYVVWMAAVFPIGWVVSHMLMASLYYFVMTPIGWLMKLCGYDPLKRKEDPKIESYWIARSPPPTKQRYFKQY